MWHLSPQHFYHIKYILPKISYTMSYIQQVCNTILYVLLLHQLQGGPSETTYLVKFFLRAIVFSSPCMKMQLSLHIFTLLSLFEICATTISLLKSKCLRERMNVYTQTSSPYARPVRLFQKENPQKRPAWLYNCFFDK